MAVNLDGSRRRARGCKTMTCREAARVARSCGLDMTARDVAAMCAEWPGEFEAFPSVPWSVAAQYDGWEWVIDARDFRAWCEWEAGR